MGRKKRILPIGSKTKLIEVKFESKNEKEAAFKAALDGGAAGGKGETLSKREIRRILFREYAIDAIIQDRRDGDIKKRLKEEDKDTFIQLTRAYLEGKTIFENREDARRLGVENACAYPKGALVDETINRIWGIQCFDKDVLITREPDITKVTLQDEFRIMENFRKGKFLVGELVSGVFEGDEMGGYLRVNRFRASADDAFIPRGVVNKMGLKSGDVLEARITRDEVLFFNCVHWIDKVNQVKVGYETFAEDLEMSRNVKLATPRNRVIFACEEYNGLPVLMDAYAPACLGQSVLVSIRGKLNYARHATELAESLRKSLKVDEVITFAPNENEFNSEKLAAECSDTIVSSPTYSNTNDKIAKRMCDYAYRRAESGYNTVVVLADLDEAAPTTEEAKELLDCSRQISGGGSCTIVAFADIDRENDRYYEIRRMVSSELRLVARPFYGDFVVDSMNCANECAHAMNEKERGAVKSLKLYIDKTDDETAQKVVMEFGTYRAFVEGMSTASYKLTRKQHAMSLKAE